MRNYFDFIDAVLCQGGVDISSLFTEEKENNTNKVTVRKASKEEIDSMVLEEIVDVYICLEKLNEKLEIIPEDFDSIYISKITRYNELMNN